MPKKRTAIFVMPRSSSAWNGAEALWITVAGWAKAAERIFDSAWVVTTDGVYSPDEALDLPVTTEEFSRANGVSITLKKYVPEVIKTVVKDIQLWLYKKKVPMLNPKGPWEGSEIAFVWQQHDLFKGPAEKFCRDNSIPLVTFVHAPVVWEAAK